MPREPSGHVGMVAGPGGIMPAHWAKPVWCQRCLKHEVDHVDDLCESCEAEAAMNEDDRDEPVLGANYGSGA